MADHSNIGAGRTVAGRARRAVGAAALVAALASGVGAAAAIGTVTNGTLLPGSVYAYYLVGTVNWCSIERGSGQYRRDSATAVVIDLPDIAMMDIPADVHRHWSGVGRLTFTGTRTGTIAFDLPPAWPNGLRSFPFENYGETWNATTKALTVNFKLGLPGCKLPITARFIAP